MISKLIILSTPILIVTMITLFNFIYLFLVHAFFINIYPLFVANIGQYPKIIDWFVFPFQCNFLHDSGFKDCSIFSTPLQSIIIPFCHLAIVRNTSLYGLKTFIVSYFVCLSTLITLNFCFDFELLLFLRILGK